MLVKKKRFLQTGQKEFSYEREVGDEDILVTITDIEGVSRTVKGKNY